MHIQREEGKIRKSSPCRSEAELARDLDKVANLDRILFFKEV